MSQLHPWKRFRLEQLKDERSESLTPQQKLAALCRASHMPAMPIGDALAAAAQYETTHKLPPGCTYEVIQGVIQMRKELEQVLHSAQPAPKNGFSWEEGVPAMPEVVASPAVPELAVQTELQAKIQKNAERSPGELLAEIDAKLDETNDALAGVFDAVEDIGRLRQSLVLQYAQIQQEWDDLKTEKDRLATEVERLRAQVGQRPSNGNGQTTEVKPVEGNGALEPAVSPAPDIVSSRDDEEPRFYPAKPPAKPLPKVPLASHLSQVRRQETVQHPSVAMRVENVRQRTAEELMAVIVMPSPGAKGRRAFPPETREQLVEAYDAWHLEGKPAKQFLDRFGITYAHISQWRDRQTKKNGAVVDGAEQ